MSEHLQIHFELHRNWLFNGYSSTFAATAQVKQHLVSAALDAVARVVHREVFRNEEPRELRNIKGRDPHEPALVNGGPPLTGEEIFTVGGMIATGADEHGFVWEPFHYSCNSRFDRFEGARTIIHSTNVSRAPTLPEWLPWWMVGAAAPLEPRYLRLGLEFFTSRFAITRLSFVPVVTDTILIDLVNNTLSMKLKTEQQYWKPCNPFETNSILQRLSQELLCVTGTPLAALFDTHLRARATF